MRKNKILLFYPKPDPLAEKCLPLNLMALERMLDRSAYEVRIINATSDPDYGGTILREAGAGTTLCFGITTLTGYQIQSALGAAAILKEKHPEIPVIWGGYHPSLLPIETLRHPAADIVVKGQGETAFRELVDALAQGKSLDNLAGIAYKTAEGELKENPDRPFEQLTAFPPLRWDAVNTAEFVRDDPQWGRRIDCYTSQGCPYNCGFCAETMFCKRKWAALSPERVLAELELLHRDFGVQTFKVHDSNFFVDKARVREICRLIKEKGLRVNFMGVNARIDTLSAYEDEDWAMLREAGFKEFLIGAESGSAEILDLIDKQINPDDIFRFFDKAKKHGFKVWVSLMTGLPSVDNSKEFHITLNLLDRLLREYPECISNSYIFQYTPYPGSRLFELAKQAGFKPPDSLDGWSRMNLYNIKASWVPQEYRAYANALSLYILPRFLNPFHSNTRLIRLFYSAVIDPLFRYRWRKRFFGFFVEKHIIDFLNFLARLKRRSAP